jgi:imidazolonepropionase-like amidohydrolase
MIADSLPDKPTRAQRSAAMAQLDVNAPGPKSVIDALVAHHTVIDPTLALSEFGTASLKRPYASFEPGVLTLPPELSRQFATVEEMDESTQRQRLQIQESLGKIVVALMHAGVPIVAGTDQGVPGHSLYRELELYVEAGFTPMQAIEAATSVPARVMGQTDSGLVQAGKRADIIVLGSNPLESIHNIRSVEKVMSAGTLYDTAPLWRSVGFKAPH